MMNARLSSLLVAGGVFLIGFQAGALGTAFAATESTLQSAVLQGATLEAGNDSEAIIRLAIPAFTGTPRLQVLTHPNRVVVDLPGVIRGVQPTRQEMAGWSSPLIRKTRLAQFIAAPNPVTRFVLEVVDGAQVDVSRAGDGLQVVLKPGTGAVQARMASPEMPAAPAVEMLAAVPAPSPDPAAVAKPAADKPMIALDPIPAITAHSQPLPVLAVSTLLPANMAAVQEKPAQAAPSPRKDDSRGRTLGDVQGRYTGSRITIDVKGADLATFLRIIADHAKLNLVADQDVQGIYDFKFTDTPWDQVLDIIVKHAGLGKEISNGVIRIAKVEKLQKEEDDRKKLEEAKALAGDLTTITRPLSFAKAAEAKAIVEKMLTKRGSIIIDDRTNVLIISDLEKNLPMIDDLIQQLDVQIQQVQVEARVVEANGNFQKAFGVKFPSADTGSYSISDSTGATVPLGSYGTGPSWNSTGGWNRPASGQHVGTSWTTNTGITDPAGELWVSFLSNRFSINVILQALETEGKIRIVSNPKIVTQNNKKATVLSGRKIPYQSNQGNGSTSTSFVDANLELNVTPQITNEGTIIMDLKIEKSEADFSNAVLGTPTIVRRAVETQVLVRDGGTAVLGGVYTNMNSDTTTGIPFLSKIPVLGWLFRSKDHQEENTELLIFVTPRIIKM
ncbi:MAG TPA: type IV pilus secretin PilQ [Holophaga sp.]|nr:type IV pilus secretin PilQ [Holophaga sp.]